MLKLKNVNITIFNSSQFYYIYPFINGYRSKYYYIFEISILKTIISVLDYWHNIKRISIS